MTENEALNLNVGDKIIRDSDVESAFPRGTEAEVIETLGGSRLYRIEYTDIYGEKQNKLVSQTFIKVRYILPNKDQDFLNSLY